MGSTSPYSDLRDGEAIPRVDVDDRGNWARLIALEEEGTISEIPLDTVKGWPDEHINRLREVWIISAEQVVALAATSGVMTSLSGQLQITEDRARELVEEARVALTPQVLSELDTPLIRPNTASESFRPLLRMAVGARGDPQLRRHRVLQVPRSAIRPISRCMR